MPRPTGSLRPTVCTASTETNLTGHTNLLVGNKINDLSFWLGYDYINARSQSGIFIGSNPGTAGPPGTLGTPVAGGFFDTDTLGRPRFTSGASGRNHNQHHLGKVRLDYEFAPNVHVNYMAGLWSLASESEVTLFVRDRNGVPIFNAPNRHLRVGGVNFFMPFGPNPFIVNQDHLNQALSIKRNTGGEFDFDVVGTSYNFLRDASNTASTFGLANTSAVNGVNTGSYWRTLDARGIWHPQWDLFGKHEVSMGAHADVYSLSFTQTNTNAFTNNFFRSIQAVNQGKTSTQGLYIQDAWRFHPDWRLTAGARGDFWQAYGGMNSRLGARNNFGALSAPNFFPGRTSRHSRRRGASNIR